MATLIIIVIPGVIEGIFMKIFFGHGCQTLSEPCDANCRVRRSLSRLKQLRLGCAHQDTPFRVRLNAGLGFAFLVRAPGAPAM